MNLISCFSDTLVARKAGSGIIKAFIEVTGQRHDSDDQRKKIFALINDICDHTGYMLDEMTKRCVTTLWQIQGAKCSVWREIKSRKNLLADTLNILSNGALRRAYHLNTENITWQQISPERYSFT